MGIFKKEEKIRRTPRDAAVPTRVLSHYSREKLLNALKNPLTIIFYCCIIEITSELYSHRKTRERRRT